MAFSVLNYMPMMAANGANSVAINRNVFTIQTISTQHDRSDRSGSKHHLFGLHGYSCNSVLLDIMTSITTNDPNNCGKITIRNRVTCEIIVE